jgi:hypothetical protein
MDPCVNPSSARVTLLVPLEAVPQRVVGDALDAYIHRRVHLDASLQQIFDPEIGVAGFELGEHVRDDRGRLEHVRFLVRHDRQGALPGGGQLVARDEPRRGHQYQGLIAAPKDGAAVVSRRRVVARRLRDAGQQRRLVSIVDSERRETSAE